MRVNRNSAYYQNLIQRVIDHSNSKIWESAVLEWEIFDWRRTDVESLLYVGKKSCGLIRNTLNGNMLINRKFVY